MQNTVLDDTTYEIPMSKENDYLLNIDISANKSNFDKAIKSYSFYYILDDSFNFSSCQDIISNLEKSEDFVIDLFLEKNQIDNFFVISFKNTIIIIKELLISSLQTFFSYKSNVKIYFLSKIKEKFNQQVVIEDKQIVIDQIFLEEIYNFKAQINFKIKSSSPIHPMISVISSCILGYLIRDSYSKLNKAQFETMNNFLKFDENSQKENEKSDKKFDENSQEENERSDKKFNENNFIDLRSIGSSMTSKVFLMYEISKGEIYAVKNSIGNGIELSKLNSREQNNYSKINHPFLPKYYGQIRNKDSLIIQFINGLKLKEVIENHKSIKLEYRDKVIIIFELMLIFKYLHENGFVYRDLKPDNIMIDENKTIFVIDFDRMININEQKDEEHTLDLNLYYSDPELKSGEVSYGNDIFSLGQIIYFIFNEKDPVFNIPESFKKDKLYLIYQQCTNDNIEKRPSIMKLMFEFYVFFSSFFDGTLFNQISVIKYFNGIINFKEEYITKDVNKAIEYLSFTANQNNIKSQFLLGGLYYKGKYIEKNIKKAIQYYSLAADQNDLDSQFMLGAIYQIDDSIPHDISKSIYYYLKAAQQNDSRAQYNLACIYYNGEYVKQDIDKAIEYYSLAADQNFPEAQNNLGKIYIEGKYVNRDIYKAIHYFTLAADQNEKHAQENLGKIYYEGKYIKQDINKSINYFTQAANQGLIIAKNYLSQIYSEGIQYNNITINGKDIKQELNKSIHYLTLAANQNDSKAQYLLGHIFYDDKYIPQDNNKAIYYFTLAANQNYMQAQYDLGLIYYENKYIKRDIVRSINYFRKSANQGHSQAQYNLAAIYYEGQYIKRDVYQSIHYFSLAARNNHSESQQFLASIFEKGIGVKQDIEKAIHYYTLAANQGELKAQFNLANIYYDYKYGHQDIDKSIYYFTLAANQNDPQAQNNLGFIYGDIKKDIKKAIHYFTLAANQNYQSSQYNLGCIYLDGKIIQRDIDKGIHYLTLSANNNYVKSQYWLGCIYYEGRYVPRDIPKSIHYLTLAANQNHVESQYNLGYLYSRKKFIKQDISKAIYYYTLAANQNCISALHNLSLLYYKGEYVPQNINKALYYASLAANQNDPKSLYCLGIFYFNTFLLNDNHNNLSIQKIDNITKKPKKIEIISTNNQNINKAIHYYTLAADHNYPEAQYELGIFYINGKYVPKDMIKGIDYLIQSSSNGYVESHFLVAFFYHQGKYVERNIKKSIHYYKEASSFNNQYAKNNLGVIYKNGVDEIQKNVGLAISYFVEVIKRFNDKLSKYNLAHLYIYEDGTIERIDESIQILLRLFYSFPPAKELLCIALIKQYGSDLKKIEIKLRNIIDYITNSDIIKEIKKQKLDNESVFKEKYKSYKINDYIYNNSYSYISSNKINEQTQNHQTKSQQKNITSDFYDGFGDL